MSEQDKGTGDGGLFEEEQGLVKLKEELALPVGAVEITPGEETMITRLDLASTHWRQAATALLKQADPEAYAKYRELKYSGGETPDLETRKKAYRFAFERFLDLSYTEIEPDAPTTLQAVGGNWRQTAVRLLQVLDPDAYATYQKMRYAKGKTPDLAVRKKAYRFAVRRFLEASYKLAGF